MWCRFDLGEKKAKRKVRERNDWEDLQELEEAVDKCVTEMFSQSSEKLVHFLDQSTESRDLDDFEIRAAVVRCSFSHVGIFRKALEDNLAADVFTVGKDSQIRHVVEHARNTKSGVFLIEQIESLSSDYVENLIYLTQWFELRHPFVICTSTGVSSFADMCSFDSLRSINAEIFNMPDPSCIYSRVMECVREQCHLKSIHLSGQVLSHLRSRYFCSSFSVEEIKRAVRLFVQHNRWLLRNDAGRNRAEFDSCVTLYWQNLDFYVSKSNVSLFECHENIQTGKFAPKTMTVPDIKEWLKNGFVDQEVRDKMNQEITAYLEGKSAKLGPETPQPATPASKKMSASQWKEQMKENLNRQLVQKQSDPEFLLKRAFNEMVRALLCPWTDFAGQEKYLVFDEPKSALFCDPASLVENAMVNEESKLEPLSIAFRTLQQRSNWKSAKIRDWIRMFEAEAVGEKSNESTISSFYAALGQLESMGVIKAASERNKGSVAILHHPVSHVLN